MIISDRAKALSDIYIYIRRSLIIMAKSFKMSNGPVRMLVEITDIKRQEELKERGFSFVRDKNGKLLRVETNRMVRSDDPEVQAIIDELD
jgi:hypothetical protein